MYLMILVFLIFTFTFSPMTIAGSGRLKRLQYCADDILDVSQF